MEFKVSYLTMALRPREILVFDDFENFYNEILSFLGLYQIRSTLKSKKSSYYDRIVYYKGIFIKVPRSSSPVQDFVIDFTHEGLETDLQFTSRSVQSLLYDFIEVFSDSCIVSCKRIDVETDYLPTHVDELIKSFSDKSLSCFSIGSRSSGIFIRSVLNSDFKLYEYSFKNLFAGLVFDDYINNPNCFSNNFKSVLAKFRPKVFNKINKLNVD